MGKLLLILFIILLFAPVTALAADLTLQWDPNPATDLAGYHLYQADRIGDKTTAWQRITTDLITTTTFTVTLPDDKNYAWLVTALDKRGNQSFVSNMVERYDQTPPPATKNLRK